MRLIIGGAHQGKLAWALQNTGLALDDVAYTVADAEDKPILNALHGEIRALMKAGQNPMKAVETLLEKNPSIVFLCDEVGCGVVPMDTFEREWREETGRICCMLAERAVRVDRIFCGISTCLKQEKTQ